MSKFIKETFQWILAVILALLIAFAIRGFIFEPVIVQGESMKNTLSTGERLIVFKLGYYFKSPQRGDIVVLKYQDGIAGEFPFLRKLPFIQKMIPPISEIDYIKRIVALPGDIIDIRDGALYINDEKQEAPYAKGSTSKGTYSFKYPLAIPQNMFFVMGDNREYSRDSREIGFIPLDRIKGKAVFRIWPLNSIGGLK